MVSKVDVRAMQEAWRRWIELGADRPDLCSSARFEQAIQAYEHEKAMNRKRRADAFKRKLAKDGVQW